MPKLQLSLVTLYIKLYSYKSQKLLGVEVLEKTSSCCELKWLWS